MLIRHVRKISCVASLFIYDEEVTIKKNLYWDILQQLRHVYCLVFAFSRSSEMSICSSLVALMALSFSPPLMKIVFLFNCRCNKLQGCP